MRMRKQVSSQEDLWKTIRIAASNAKVERVEKLMISAAERFLKVIKYQRNNVK